MSEAQLTDTELRKLRHILGTFFIHENPPEVAAAAGSLGFSPFDNSPVTRQFEDGTDTDGKNRWPRNQTRPAARPQQAAPQTNQEPVRLPNDQAQQHFYG